MIAAASFLMASNFEFEDHEQGGFYSHMPPRGQPKEPPKPPAKPTYRDARHRRQVEAKLARQAAAAKRGKRT